MALPGDFAKLASFPKPFLNIGLLANTKPVTNTNTICIENASNAQNPSPQNATICTGEESVNPKPSTKITTVKIITNKNGSGKYFSIKLFEKRVIPFIL